MLNRWFARHPASRPPRRFLLTLLAALLALGWVIHDDYGFAWDEFNDRNLGIATAHYVAKRLVPDRWQHLVPNDPRISWLPTSGIVHGPVVEAPAAALGRFLYPGNPRGYYTVRHGFVFLVFVAGVLALYGLGWLRFRDWRLALLGASILVLSPRFFAEAFYNGKDVGFMALFTVAMFTLAWLLRRPTAGRVLLHALATGAAIGVRMPGVLLPALTLAWLGWQAWQEQPGWKRTRLWGLAGLYVVAAPAATVALWPYLWETSLASFRYVLGVMSQVPWPCTVLYWGHLVPAPALPWHYLPVMVLVTTPVPYVLAALLGSAAVTGRAWQRRSQHWALALQFDALFAAWLGLPLLAIVVLHSVVFDGWRHVYFIYPGLLLLAVRGVQVLSRWACAPHSSPGVKRKALARLALGAGAASLLHTAYWQIQAHPNQQAYFSCVPSEAAERLFERDYWALGNRYGLEWLLANDQRPVLTVTGPRPVLLYASWLLLAPAQQQRIRVVYDTTARYYMDGYRWHPQSYADTLGPEVLAYRPGGAVKILSVFRREPRKRPLPNPSNGLVLKHASAAIR